MWLLGHRRGRAGTRELQHVEHAVARILAETEAPVEVYEATLDAIGRTLSWQLGAVWETDAERLVLHCVRTWSSSGETTEFERMSAHLELRPGEGLPGSVLATGRPQWIVDSPRAGNFPRAEAAERAGLRAAFGFPLHSPRGIVGVMEFFTGDLRELDGQLLDTMHVIGSQVGQFVSRRHVEEEVRRREARLRAMLESALDAVVTMNAQGVVVDWNSAAEAIFGYTADEVVGRDMAELIVPPHLRDAHRFGLARQLAGGPPVVLDRRVELTGMRKGGDEFPVELTVTRIDLPGEPLFTGYLRDIGDRKRAEADLRASRARLVEVADGERRRIQRNLHDGAQQRLTSVLLNLGRLRESTTGETTLLDRSIDELTTGLQEIRHLANGLHPPVLAERGLAAALEALALRAPLPVDVEQLPDRRLAEQVEAAGYYVAAEALANVQKHAGARRAVISAAVVDGNLAISVSDDGSGGADDGGSGLRGLADRVEALGGVLVVDSPESGGTTLAARIPVG